METFAPAAEPEIAKVLARESARRSRPRARQLHLLDGHPDPQLLVVNGTRLYDLSVETAARVRSTIEADDAGALERLLSQLGLDAPLAIDDRPLEEPEVHALSLAVAQKCNLGCTYCYAQQGTFGGPAKSMSAETARRSIDLLLMGKSPQSRVTLAFLGGEPLANRPVIRDATRYAAARAAQEGVSIQFSITTNGTLLTEDDAEFFEEHGFAVTVSLDGLREEHDRLRVFRDGSGSYDRIIERVRPLLLSQRRMQVSARVTVTAKNIDLVRALDEFIAMGFHSVGFSPLLRSSDGRLEMTAPELEPMLEGMIACGLAFERRVLCGERYPFLNMVNALRELDRGTHRPYPCGAGAGYFGVSAEGELAACHRFVDDTLGAMGNLESGIDRQRQNAWLAERHVHQQEPCHSCWARYLCGGGCHHEVLARGRPACDYIRGWLHYTIGAYGRLSRLAPHWFQGEAGPSSSNEPLARQSEAFAK
jgi:uncharacterized protein